MPPKPKIRTRIRKWAFTVRRWPVAVLVFSEIQLLTWKGWQSWLWMPPVVASLYLVFASLQRGEKSAQALEEVRADLQAMREANAAMRAEWHD